MLFGLSASLALVFPKSGIGAEEEVKMVDFVDDINAYTYLYPTELPSKRLVFKWVLTLLIYFKGGIKKARKIFLSCSTFA